MKNKLFISFSGGRTSAYMTKRLIDENPDKEIVVLFANTGQEHPETLKFVKRCDEEFGFGVVWLEAVVDHRGRGPKFGTKHRVVTFKKASRKGQPYEDVIVKYGIPNKSYNHCTRETKLQPMLSYVRTLGWKNGEFSTAVGIRADEIDRVSLTAMKKGIFYPCIDWGVKKTDIQAWWDQQDFRLELPEHLGNCLWCWKKSDRKLLTVIKSNPEYFEFPDRMEKEHAFSGGERRDGGKRDPRVFFRKNRTTQDLLTLSKQPFTPFVDGNFIEFDDELDVGGGCGNGCEIGTDMGVDDEDLFEMLD